MKIIRVVVIVASLVLMLTTIVPNAANAYLVELPGTLPFLYNAIPFSYSLFGTGRYQQVYDSSLFGEKGFITSILFIPSYTGTYGANIAISLAYASVSPGNLSVELDSNVSGQSKVVLSDPNFSTSVTAGWYYLVFDFSSPTIFFYDPDQGNLLVDIVISDQTSNMTALKFNPPYPYLSSRAWNSSNIGNGNDTDEGAPPAALLTRFQFTPIPDVWTYFDENVVGGTLVGVGQGNSANGRLVAFGNMIENSYNLIANGNITGACQQLLDAMNRCDGEIPPPDFVGGESAYDLWMLIDDLRVTLGCRNT